MLEDDFTDAIKRGTLGPTLGTLGGGLMAEGDNGPKTPAAAPQPKPSVPVAAPPRPGGVSRANPPPAPVVAKVVLPPLDEANPFLPPESSSKIDAGWLAMEDASDSLELVSADAPPPPPPPPARPPGPPPPRIAPPPRLSPPPPPPIAKVEPPTETTETTAAVGDVEPANPQSVDDSESTPDSVPFKKKSRGKVLALAFLAVLVIAGAGFGYQSQMAARDAKPLPAAPQTATTTAEPVLTVEPPPPPIYKPEPPPSASAAPPPAATGGGGAAPIASIEPAARAFLDATQLPPGRKIVVDGRVIGTSPRKVPIRCGMHRVQIGDQDPENIDFPCGGGEVSFTE